MGSVVSPKATGTLRPLCHHTCQPSLERPMKPIKLLTSLQGYPPCHLRFFDLEVLQEDQVLLLGRDTDCGCIEAG